MGEGWWGGAESLIQGQLKLHPFPGRNLAKAISMTNSGMLYRLDISTFYFDEPLLFQIFVPWKFNKNLCPPLSAITFTVESHADNHFYKYIYLFQILCSMKSVFLLKYRCSIFNFKVFYIQTWFTYEAPLLFFQIKTMIYRRKHYRKIYERILIYMLYTHGVTCSLSRWNNGDNDICKKYQ